MLLCHCECESQIDRREKCHALTHSSKRASDRLLSESEGLEFRRPKASLIGEGLATPSHGDELSLSQPALTLTVSTKPRTSTYLLFTTPFRSRGRDATKNDLFEQWAGSLLQSPQTHVQLLRSMANQPCGVHLVGSIVAQTSEEAFVKSYDGLPGRLCRVPDGETGERDCFTGMFRDHIPEAYLVGHGLDAGIPENQVKKDLQSFQTGYDTAALYSYAVFRRLKESGKLPQDIRFQVSLPTPVNIVIHVKQSCRLAFDRIVETALIENLHNIQKAIPYTELAIQFDCAIDMAFLEGDVTDPRFAPALSLYFEPVREGLLQSIARLSSHVQPAVELGFHLCYGDLGGVHFKEPSDMAKMVDFASGITERVQHPISWFHMPVPKDRLDDAYFAPLKSLGSSFGNTQLYLGLVHQDDEDGTRKRIQTAQKVLKDFGVSSECGFGRSSPERMASIFKIASAVSNPYQ